MTEDSSHSVTRCSFSNFHKEPCGIYSRNPEETSTIRLFNCTKDIANHLRSLQVSVGCQDRGFKSAPSNSILSEADLLCRRIGFFSTDLALTVCPLHRFKLGIDFKQSRTCAYPSHSGKGKTFRGATVRQSRKILQDTGVLVPVGSGLCQKCYTLISRIVADGPEFDADLIAFSTENAGDISHVEDTDGKVYELRKRAREDKTYQSSGYDFLMQDSSQSEASDNLSQSSTWSQEENDLPLADLNKAIETFSSGQVSPIKNKIRSDVDMLCDSTKRGIKRKANSLIFNILDCYAPGQADKLIKLCFHETPSTVSEDTKLQQLIIQLYNDASDRKTKVQLLSMVSDLSSKRELQERIPGVSQYAIDTARQHAAQYGKGVAVPATEGFFRQRLDQDKLAHALDFFLNPTFNMVCSYGTKDMKLGSGEVVVIPEVVRTVGHSTLIKMYVSFCEESGYQPLSLSTLFKILQSCPASKRTNLKGLDNIAADGLAAYDSLSKVVTDLQRYAISQNEKLQLISQNILASKVYLKTDYKLHLQTEDPCSDHCITYALTDDTNRHLQALCQHDHDVQCDRCNLLPSAISDLQQILSEEKEIPEEKVTEMLSDIDMANLCIAEWKEHIVRSVNQDKGRTDLLEDLKGDEALIIMDWAMKFLPMAFREKQSDWFAQKGINWHVSVCIFKDELGNLKHRTYTHVFDSAVKQDWFAVASILEDLLQTVKLQIPKLTKVNIRSDNAGCYHCGNLWLALPGISERTGIQISRYDYSESQCGKSYCDAKIAHMRCRIRQFVASGNNVRSSGEMKAAIDSFGGVVGCQASDVGIDTQKQIAFNHSWKGITKINNIKYNTDGSIVVWRAYGIGEGNTFSKNDVIRMCPIPQSDTGLLTIQGFNEPNTREGSIKQEKQANQLTDQQQTEFVVMPTTDSDNYSDVFHCPEEGCKKVFKTYAGLELHQIFGQHKFILNKRSTYDEIRLQWKQCCETLTEGTLAHRNHPSTAQGKNVNNPGWALRKDRKIVRHSEKVKSYLRGMFEAGERSGNKFNPSNVASNMRVCVDEDGNKMFQPHEYLKQGQIASFFSRLSVMSKVPPAKRQSIDEADLETAIAHLNTIEAIEIINQDI